MKKLFAIICALCVAHCAFLNAQALSEDTVFTNMGDLALFIKNEASLSQKRLAYEVEEPVVVTFVGENNYLQYFDVDTVIHGVKFNNTDADYTPQVGDVIKVTGVFAADKYTSGKLSEVATFKAIDVELVKSDSSLVYTTVNADEGFQALQTSNISSLVRMGGGALLSVDDKYYLSVTLGDKTESILVSSVGDVDLSSFVGKMTNLLYSGIFTFEGEWVLFVNEMYDPVVYHETIADLISNYDIESINGLRNAVLLSYIHNATGGTFIFIEDSTGALYMQCEKNKELNVEAGDSIINVMGKFDISKNAPFLWATASFVRNLDLVKVSDGVLEPTSVTLAELVADFKLAEELLKKRTSPNSEEELVAINEDMEQSIFPQYANRVVIINNLMNKTGLSASSSNKKFWMYQGEDSIQFNSYWWDKTGAIIYDNIGTLIGVVDYNGVTNGTSTPPILTVTPMNAECVVEYEEGIATSVDQNESGNIYVENRAIVSNEDIQIFTVAGQNVTAKNGSLAAGVYVVCTSNAVVKLVVK